MAQRDGDGRELSPRFPKGTSDGESLLSLLKLLFGILTIIQI